MTENPKDIAGSVKLPFADIPGIVLAEVGLAMHEGARKYGAYNWRRDAITSSAYYSAAMRHLFQWWELGEDADADSGLSHITKAIACLMVLRDAQINGMVKDDRPPNVHGDRWYTLQDRLRELQEKHPDPKARVTEWGDADKVPTKYTPWGADGTYRFYEPKATEPLTTDSTTQLEKQSEALEKYLKKGSPLAPYPAKPGETNWLAGVEAGEYYEPPVAGYTR